ncbi:hypothetical protein BKM31_39485 [[Actinomadura] parvosata subsp. kistnae]|uniref:PBS lyase n=2 Tax=Nonomuraea TaxID=83681 RepID=A0A1V0A9A1_9ACTN|nr:HEAT repeat domain-containing protein [Nonomuraea sp. ATCC 55076]AQZ66722.1 hypothetical protein BKM31_39485 [Nonomuraea sp. ATCC 55076]
MLAACAWDGRERARALTHPSMRTEPALLPVLLIRTTDWAEPVRDLALEALEEALRDADATTLLAAVPTAARLRRRTRARPALDLVRAALLRASDDTLDAVRACQDRLGRRFTYEVALDAGRLDPARLTAAALHEHDQISRTRCARALADAAVTHERPDLATAILDGTTAEGRVQALTALVRLGHVEHGHRFLDDPASMVRLTAQWALRKSGTDPATLYRRALTPDRAAHAQEAERAARLQEVEPTAHAQEAEQAMHVEEADQAAHVEESEPTAYTPEPGVGRAVRGLLAGLGDCGTKADAPLVLPYLSAPSPRVRAEAVRTLRRLGATADVIPLLEDPAPVVVREVVTTLTTVGPTVPIEHLWPLLPPDRPRHVRQAAHRLLVARTTWSRIKADLLLLHDPDERLRARARDDLILWCRTDATRPYHRGCPPDVRTELETLVAAAGTTLGEENARLLRVSLQLPA